MCDLPVLPGVPLNCFPRIGSVYIAVDFWKRFICRTEAGLFRDGGDELCGFCFSRNVIWLSIRDRGHDVGLPSKSPDSLRKQTEWKENNNKVVWFLLWI